MAVKSDIERYRTNYLAEQKNSELYQSLAKTERDPHLAELYQRMAEAEQSHASVWVDYLRKAGKAEPTYTPGWRIRKSVGRQILLGLVAAAITLALDRLLAGV
jgi:rubrerythrin